MQTLAPKAAWWAAIVGLKLNGYVRLRPCRVFPSLLPKKILVNRKPWNKPCVVNCYHSTQLKKRCHTLWVASNSGNWRSVRSKRPASARTWNSIFAHAPNSHFDTWTLSYSRGGGTHILLEFIQSFDLELVFQGIIQRELLTWPFPLSVSDSQRGHPWASSPPWWQPIDQKSVAAKRWW